MYQNRRSDTRGVIRWHASPHLHSIYDSGRIDIHAMAKVVLYSSLDSATMYTFYDCDSHHFAVSELHTTKRSLIPVLDWSASFTLGVGGHVFAAYGSHRGNKYRIDSTVVCQQDRHLDNNRMAMRRFTARHFRHYICQTTACCSACSACSCASPRYASPCSSCAHVRNFHASVLSTSSPLGFACYR